MCKLVLFSFLFIFLFNIIGKFQVSGCDTIQCKGKLFETVQIRNIFGDGKKFVDMATKYSPETILESFESLPSNVSNDELRQFVKNNFFEPGYELDTVRPEDWIEDPDVLSKQRNLQLLEMATEVHRKWFDLSRQINESKLPEDSVSTLIPVKNPFIIVGGRFTEFYYWDSYWIIEGLLASQMTETAGNFIQNFLEIINRFNFMPNGARTYFLNRSQPPFLIKMISSYFDHTSDNKFLFESLRTLDREYDFFMKERATVVNLYGSKHRLNLYSVENDEPRPESFKEDTETSQVFDDEKKRKKFYASAASAAESGWDFSSRWLNLQQLQEQYDHDLSSMDTINMIPVDLNAQMYYNERNLQRFNCKFATQRAEFYTKCFWYGRVARNRFKSMKKVLFNSETKHWSDFNITSGKNSGDQKVKVNHRNEIDMNGHKEIRPLYLSDLSPLWFFSEEWRTNDVRRHETQSVAIQEKEISAEIKLMNDALMDKLTENVEEILDLIENGDDALDMIKFNDWQEMIFKPNGVPMSNINSGEQWDYPNAWAPYQMFLIDTLLRYDDENFGQQQKYKRLALHLAKKWLQTNFCGYKKSGTFFEKYNVDKIGQAGEGGEYEVVEGFGWTNGVIMYLANKLGPEIELDSKCNWS